MIRRNRFVGALTALATAASFGCSDSPTQPANSKEPESFELTRDAGIAFATTLEDARVRILPALDEATRTASLRQALEDLSLALDTKDRAALVRALARADDALAALDGEDGDAAAIAADLDAVRLILAEARPLLEDSATIPAP